MATTSCHITTFNCGREPIDLAHFAASLHDSLTALPPDLIVLALQELAPLGPSFIGGSLLTPYFARLADAVHKATSQKYEADADYEEILVRNVGMTALMVFGRREVRGNLRWSEAAGTGVGVWEMGNKGAVGVRLGLDAGALAFVAAHLAPAEDQCERRNADWKSICETLVFETVQDGKTAPAAESEAEPLLAPEQDDSSSKPTHTLQQRGLFGRPAAIFLAGDLNYRTSDSPPGPDDHKSWPHLHPEDPDYATAHAKLFAHDQLTRELKRGSTCHSLTEAPLTFPPTYKYSSDAQAGLADAAPWATHRTPSWCDRILFLARAAPKVHGYTALPVQPTSDHRPVCLSVAMRVDRLLEISSVEAPFPIAEDWLARRTAARRLEILVGLGAYLGFTGQGQAMLGGVGLGALLLYFALRY